MPEIHYSQVDDCYVIDGYKVAPSMVEIRYRKRRSARLEAARIKQYKSDRLWLLIGFVFMWAMPLIVLAL